jgi:uncharacterized protein (DUF433 family)
VASPDAALPPGADICDVCGARGMQHCPGCDVDLCDAHAEAHTCAKPHLRCPHGRPSHRVCPHCLGLSTGRQRAEAAHGPTCPCVACVDVRRRAIPPTVVLDALSMKGAEAAVIEEFPGLTTDDIQAALNAGARALRRLPRIEAALRAVVGRDPHFDSDGEHCVYCGGDREHARHGSMGPHADGCLWAAARDLLTEAPHGR